MPRLISPSAARMPAADPSLEDLLDDLARRLQTGDVVDIDAYAQAHPGHAEEIRRVLPAMKVLAQLNRSAASATLVDHAPAAGLDLLGDFRILREIGRGGMGVVYEAEQISLGRKVALKVLPLAAALDPRHLARFQNEAQAAARLHHTNIVPVYFVGCERGVHFYAMQFIHGQTLAAVIHGLQQQKLERERGRLGDKERRRQGDKEMGRGGDKETGSEGDKEMGRQGDKETGKGCAATPAPSEHLQASLASLSPCLPISLSPSLLVSQSPGLPVSRSPSLLVSQSPCLPVSSSGFFRTVAELGIQAAEALEHAHQMGVIHRDIKPSNLIIQGEACEPCEPPQPREPGASAPGALRLWITDVGLAQFQADSRLTLTGDLVGTLRYMSPEQALAQRGVVDHRADVYSLGATLYELLTLQPAFAAEDRQELLRQIAFEEPKPPRKIDRTIPLEMQTIVLKAMERDPGCRYATAQALADDLRRFLNHEPLQARPMNRLARVRRWCQHPQRIRDAGAYSMLLGVVLVVWTTWGVTAFLAGVVQPDRPRLFVGSMLVAMAGFYLSMVWIGYKTIKGNFYALLAGLVVSLIAVMLLGSELVNGFMDVGGVNGTEAQARLANDALFATLGAVQFLAFVVGLVAYSSSRGSSRWMN